jgi:hypothetical protein
MVIGAALEVMMGLVTGAGRHDQKTAVAMAATAMITVGQIHGVVGRRRTLLRKRLAAISGAT